MNNIQKAFKQKQALSLRSGQCMADGGIVDPLLQQQQQQIQQPTPFASAPRQDISALMDATNGASPGRRARGLLNAYALSAPEDRAGMRSTLTDSIGSMSPGRKMGVLTGLAAFDASHPQAQQGMGVRSPTDGVRSPGFAYAEGGIVRGKGGPTDDAVPMSIGGTPVNLSNREAVLPVKTVNALGGPEAVEDLIEQTNGKPPVSKGLRAGGHYDRGVVAEYDPLRSTVPGGNPAVSGTLPPPTAGTNVIPSQTPNWRPGAGPAPAPAVDPNVIDGQATRVHNTSAYDDEVRARAEAQRNARASARATPPPAAGATPTPGATPGATAAQGLGRQTVWDATKNVVRNTAGAAKVAANVVAPVINTAGKVLPAVTAGEGAYTAGDDLGNVMANDKLGLADKLTAGLESVGNIGAAGVLGAVGRGAKLLGLPMSVGAGMATDTSLFDPTNMRPITNALSKMGFDSSLRRALDNRAAQEKALDDAINPPVVKEQKPKEPPIPGSVDRDDRTENQKAAFAKTSELEAKGLSAAAQFFPNEAVPKDLRVIRQNETNAPMAVWNSKDDKAAQTIGSLKEGTWIKPEDGTGIVSIRQKDGSYKNVAIGKSEYTDTNGNTTNDFSKTAQHQQGLADAQRVKDQVVTLQRMNAEADMQSNDPRARANGVAMLNSLNADRDANLRSKTEADNQGLRKAQLDFQERQLKQGDSHFQQEIELRKAMAAAGAERKKIDTINDLYGNEFSGDKEKQGRWQDFYRANFMSATDKDGKPVRGLKDMHEADLQSHLPELKARFELNERARNSSLDGTTIGDISGGKTRDIEMGDIDWTNWGVPVFGDSGDRRTLSVTEYLKRKFHPDYSSKIYVDKGNHRYRLNDVRGSAGNLGSDDVKKLTGGA